MAVAAQPVAVVRISTSPSIDTRTQPIWAPVPIIDHAAARQATSTRECPFAGIDRPEAALRGHHLGTRLGNSMPRSRRPQPLPTADADEREDAGGEQRGVFEPDRRRSVR